MVSQRRNTSPHIGRLVAFILSLLVIHAIARALHVWGVLATEPKTGLWPQISVGDNVWSVFTPTHYTFWEFDASSVESGRWGIMLLHFLGAIAFGLVVVAVIFFYRFSWRLIARVEDDLTLCNKRDCACIEHEGMVFNEKYQYWDFPSDDSISIFKSRTVNATGKPGPYG